MVGSALAIEITCFCSKNADLVACGKEKAAPKRAALCPEKCISLIYLSRNALFPAIYFGGEYYLMLTLTTADSRRPPKDDHLGLENNLNSHPKTYHGQA